MLRRALLLASVLASLAGPALAVPAAWTTFESFAGQTDSFTTPGSHTSTVPIGARQLVITSVGAGGGGTAGPGSPAPGTGGSGGGQSVKTLTMTGADYGKTFTCTAGTHGNGGVFGSTGPSNGTATTVANGTDSQTVSLSDGGGGAGGGAGGTASGGDTNTVGTVGTASLTGGGAPNGGNPGFSSSNGNPGGDGSCTFDYTRLFPANDNEPAREAA